MVSNTLGMTLDDLVDRLRAIAEEYADDPEYAGLRSALPTEFPF